MKFVTAHNLADDREATFSADNSAEWIVSYCYLSDKWQLHNLMVHRDDGRLVELYDALPITYGAESIGCGDWAVLRG